ncbi:acetyltransferase [Vibrio cholerae]|nr:acetyltransferase [Vibrio cholerae]ELE7142788.1 acetyltransferase [Vibrio cholerae]ELU8126888.1 acetyltransferase [Vibrio cholerae]HAS3166084.1 acetyltransferase [Vibrio cholerae]
MVAVVVFEFSGMRCQPLRRALYVSEELWIKLNLLKSSKK